ncbi:deoxyguanosinetriphosphate triphosphohydrolase [Aeromicrobium chenweiae]|uniref:Deoxyguanosinetriphosphate triphosphohydrolase n=1 Tax=Aeromicrobium chenweiae TaxID=2079793 RepID=A0A2S0WKP2_9ACTN|nr:deoxyguanosinetriphosphate triphosphohydrolase [Aeromicrobium chenweiae]AWB91844.1 deoxyguanosinetriphosphate triphosphohydrolase [Aeromicrobium chenweiae]TGN32688.1 deoxyguanosinetriphosphate triphosphohydrolase [Aeromicrobium chenweiae]
MTDAPYGDEAYERFVDEPPKRSGRTSFERDRGRIVHSAALRRLSAKTQVMGAGFDDFVRNRLTHSLEVAQVARELGKALGCDPDIVDSAALAHDLGHPPFGHNGEVALDEAAQSCGGFEGNAQTLRILSRLESKAFGPDGRSVGLNLTRATLSACVKYPWRRGEVPEAAGKFGVYTDDLPVFDWLRDGAPARRRPIEAQVMDLADDIAYSVHDVEDGVVGGWFGLRAGELDTAAIHAVARDWYDHTATDDRLDAALERLQEMPEWPTTGFDGSRAERAVLKSLTSALIGRFAHAAEAATVQRWGGGPLTRFGADLEVPTGTRDEITVLKSIAAHYVMQAQDRAGPLSRQRELLLALVDALDRSEGRQLEAEFAEDFARAEDDAARHRVLIDQVASLTDVSARAWGLRLLG